MLSLFLLTSVGTPPADDYWYEIRGRAVNAQGQPLPSAYVLVTSGPDNKGGDFYYSYEADASGRIRLRRDDSNLIKSTRVLYVTGPHPSNAITLLTPPFNEYGSLDGPVYEGHQIRIKKNGVVNIGDVPVRVFYHRVKVYLQDSAGEPLIKDAAAWRKVVLRVLDEKGSFLVGITILDERIERAVNHAESSVTIALPEGVWRVEVSPGENSPWLTSKSTLHVKPSNNPLQVVLK